MQTSLLSRAQYQLCQVPGHQFDELEQVSGGSILNRINAAYEAALGRAFDGRHSPEDDDEPEHAIMPIRKSGPGGRLDWRPLL
jgi:hypothetical protein